MSDDELRVALIGCGLIGEKRAAALGPKDTLVGCYDVSADVRAEFALRHATQACADVGELLALQPDVVLVAVTHDALAGHAELALRSGAHVLVEKPAALGSAQVEQMMAAERSSGRRVKVGFNHRFHPGLAKAAEEVRSGRHGELLNLRARYGHGGRPGYDREWRAQPDRSGGGEMIDQGMHLIDLTHWMAGPLPLHSALLRTQFWDTPVEDNAALMLGDATSRTAPWGLLHVSWTEWKNMFSMEIYCRTAKLQVDGLTGSYGNQRLRIYRMRPEMGPPDIEELSYPEHDSSWKQEWEHFSQAIRAGDGRALLGDLADAHYAWTVVEAAYAQGPYSEMRGAIAL
jgi:predicted dehydrogenase